jgi:alpha-tubulin suppressor-like RCC1 family protein
VPGGAPCPDVLVIGARGSGEAPQANGGIDPTDYANDPYDGMGINNYTVYQRLHDTHPVLHIAYEGVVYPAEPVLGATPSLLNNPSSFIASAQAGASWLTREVSQIDTWCKHNTKFVLTGYSQGAWVVHSSLIAMGATLRKQVVGVTLFGDALYLPFQSYNRVNNAVNTLLGVANLADAVDALIPKDIRARTADYCHTVDPICQFSALNLTQISEHMDYVAKGDVVAAADYVAPNLPAPVAWTNISLGSPPLGVVGQAYSWTFTAADGVGKFVWSSSGALPPGLQLSSAGKLTGTPSTIGTFSFTVKATDSIGRSAAADYSITVNPPGGWTPANCQIVSCTVSSWGDNRAGQLGDGSTVLESATPVTVSGLSDVTAVEAGQQHGLALKKDGSAWAWGLNNVGQLGNGATTGSQTPVQVGLSGISAISAGFNHNLALMPDGTVYAWGSNYDGELGDGTTNFSTNPVRVQGLPLPAVAVDASNHDSFALLTDGTVYSWGDNFYGQLGDGTTTSSTVPVRVASLSGVVAISAGTTHVMALKSDGTVWTWGDNSAGQLGDGTLTNSSVPIPVPGLSGVAEIAAGHFYSLALSSGGAISEWGAGLGSSNSSTPRQVSAPTGIRAISAGGYHALALRSDGTVWAWGDNTTAEQLGSATISSSAIPVQVAGISAATSIAAGLTFSFALHN